MSKCQMCDGHGYVNTDDLCAGCWGMGYNEPKGEYIEDVVDHKKWWEFWK